MKNNVSTVKVTVSESGKLNTVIEDGITLNNSKEIRGFDMKIKGGAVRWNDGKKLGTVQDDKLLEAGFYLQSKNHNLRNGEYPYYLNIGKRFQGGYETDREVLVQVSPVCELSLFSAETPKTDIISECVNFPKSSQDFCGELLIRIPDGCFLQVNTRFGSVCVLNIQGKLTQHFGDHPNPNTESKAVEAALKRSIWTRCKSVDPSQLFRHSLENAFAA